MDGDSFSKHEIQYQSFVYHIFLKNETQNSLLFKYIIRKASPSAAGPPCDCLRGNAWWMFGGVLVLICYLFSAPGAPEFPKLNMLLK